MTDALTMTPRRRWVCMNPDCRERRQSRWPRVLMVGALAAGSRVELRCPKCNWLTVVAVDEAGGVTYGLKEGRMNGKHL